MAFTFIPFLMLAALPSVRATPDLLPDQAATRDSIRFENRFFEADSCALEERCVLAPGQRRLLRFDSVVWNLGSSDLLLGNPEVNGLFEFSACHGHHHLDAVMEYELVELDGSQVRVARKQGFCLLDMFSGNGSFEGAKFDCLNQGLSVGWSDQYDSEIECQWPDVTEVESGNYVLRLTVNPSGILEEEDLSNNQVEIPVVIPDADQAG